MCTSAPPNACAVKPPLHRTSVVFCHELGVFLMATSFSESWIFNCFGTVQDGPRMTTEMMGKWWANPLVVQICTNHLALPDLLDIFGPLPTSWMRKRDNTDSSWSITNTSDEWWDHPDWTILTHRWPFTTELLSSFIPKCSYSAIGTLGQGSVWSTLDLCVLGRQDTNKGRTTKITQDSLQDLPSANLTYSRYSNIYIYKYIIIYIGTFCSIFHSYVELPCWLLHLLYCCQSEPHLFRELAVDGTAGGGRRWSRKPPGMIGQSKWGTVQTWQAGNSTSKIDGFLGKIMGTY